MKELEIRPVVSPRDGWREVRGGSQKYQGISMHNDGGKRELSRAVIRLACKMLNHARKIEPVFTSDLPEPGTDCRVLLHDATKLFCDAVSEQHGGRFTHRWSPELPEFLAAHPDRWEETLALVERKDFQDMGELQPVTT